MSSDNAQACADLSAVEVECRREAARHLGQQVEISPDCIVALVQAAGDEDDEVAEWSIAALERCGPALAEHCSELMALANDADADKAWWAVTILGRMEQAATPAISTLVQLLKQCAETNVRQRAAWALGQIGACSSEVVTELESARRSGDPRLSRLAEDALKRIPD